MHNSPSPTEFSSLAAALLSIVIAAAVFLPLGYLLIDAVPRDAQAWQITHAFLVDANLHGAVWRTLGIAVAAGLLCAVCATPVAFVAIRAPRIHRGLALAFGLLPLATPPYVIAAAAAQAITTTEIPATLHFGGLGVSTSAIALVVTYAVHYLPLVAVLLMLRLGGIDRGLQESASNLGAGTFTVWRRITLPLLMPAYLTAIALMMLRILEDVATPLMLGVNDMLAPSLLQHWKDVAPDATPLILRGAILLLMSSLVAVIAWSGLRATQTVAEAPDTCTLQWRRCSANHFWSTVGVAVLALITLTPISALLYGYLASPTAGLAIEDLRPNILTSVLIGIGVGGGGMLLATASAMLTRCKGKPAGMLRATTTSLYAVPGVLLAIAVMRYASPITDQFSLTTGAFSIGVVLISLQYLPYLHFVIAQGLGHAHKDLNSVTKIKGTPGVITTLRFVLPAMKWYLWLAFLVGFVGAVSEVSMLLLMTSDQSAQPLSLFLFEQLSQQPTSAFGITAGLVLSGMIAAAVAAAFWVRPSYASVNRGHRCE